MLDFIVLGEIPGTSVQIGFYDVIRLGAALVAAAVLWFEFKRYQHRPRPVSYIDPEEIAL